MKPFFLNSVNSLKLLSIAVLSIFLFTHQARAQHVPDDLLKGKVQATEDSSRLPGVRILLLPGGNSTQTDGDGYFEIPKSRLDQVVQLVFTSSGRHNDTLSIKDLNTDNTIHVFLKHNKSKLNEVKVLGKADATHMDMLSMGNVQKLGQGELLKAACCNLSESFETTPSVDVGFTDAVSGYKQIKLLGLSGFNTSFTRENIPDVRGLAAVTGLTFTPGVWVESMQLSKGVGSVVNGYEGTAGQINVEWWKAFEEKTPRWYLNAYQSSQGRTEGNIIFNHQFNEYLSTGVFLHGSGNWLVNDQNKDGFLDNPMGKNFVASNRWFWFTPTNWEFQAGVKGVYLSQQGGQIGFNKNEIADSSKPWGYQQNLKRIEGWAKLGRVYKETPWKSMGLQLSASHHQQESRYGLRPYDGKENTFYANYIYQSIISNTNNVIKFGASYSFNQFDESFIGNHYFFNESVPGIFGEYTYKYMDKFGLVAGLRADYHNLYGLFFTPRLHFRYAPQENSVLRASFGRAQRTANIFAENAGYLASNRNFVLPANNNGLPYGLKPEIAWNAGLSFLQKFLLNYRDGSVLIDYFYTNFQNQVVVDIEKPSEVKLYNLNGASYAHSVQAQLDYEPIRFWDVRLAYRYYFIRSDYSGTLKEQPLVAAHRAFLNTGYQTKNKWSADYTLQWVGPKRVPAYFLGAQQHSEYNSPSFIQMNIQISKTWDKSGLEWYLGVENLTNYMQPNLILNAENPFRQGFDASLVWGLGNGRNIYTGIRWKI